MIAIHKSAPPNRFIEQVGVLKRTPNATVNYDNLSTDGKHAALEGLLRDQHYICAYCMQRIGTETSPASIEHLVPRHDARGQSNDQESLDYGNMLAVCVSKGADTTCDKHRGNRELKVNPLKENTLRGISYGKDGSIHSDDPEIDRDLCTILNLNGSGYLKRARRSTMRKVENFVSSLNKDGTKAQTRTKLKVCEDRRERMLQEPQYEEFIGVSLYRLDHFIDKFTAQLKEAR